MFNSKIYKKHISEPWFSLIATGCKTVEGRLHNDDWEKMRQGDIIDWYNLDFTPHINRELQTIIIKKVVYPSFQSYLFNEGLNITLPSFQNIDDGLKLYYTYYKPEEEKKYGVVAFHIKLISKN